MARYCTSSSLRRVSRRRITYELKLLVLFHSLQRLRDKRTGRALIQAFQPDPLARPGHGQRSQPKRGQALLRFERPSNTKNSKLTICALFFSFRIHQSTAPFRVKTKHLKGAHIMMLFPVGRAMWLSEGSWLLK